MSRFVAALSAAGCALAVGGAHAAAIVSATPQGVVAQGGAILNQESQCGWHRTITDAVHAEGGKIALQILHAGRYSYQRNLVAPSPLQAPINPFMPQALSDADIRQTIADFAQCARLAQQAVNFAAFVRKL